MKNPMKEAPLLFSLPSYAQLARRLTKKSGCTAGEIEIRKFPDGERYLRILSEARGRRTVLLGGTTDDAATLDLFDLASGLVAAGSRELTILLPYFGYSTMERSVRPGEVVKAKVRARLFSAIPLAPYGNRIVLLDLHSEGIPFYFEGGISPLHLYAKSLILATAKRVGGTQAVLGCVDAGRAKWVESLANDLGVSVGFVYKRRSSGRKTEVSGINVSVKGKRVVLYDDMIRTGGSVIQAARAYQEAGATSISLISTHGLFTDNGLKRLRDSGVIERVFCTDSHPNAVAALATASAKGFLEVLSIDDLLASCIKGERFVTH